MSNLDKIFDSYSGGSIFKNKRVLQTNHTPGKIPHRDQQIEAVGSILSPALKGERVSNLFVYGKTGCIAGDSLIYTNNGWIKIKDADHKRDKVLSFNIKSKQYEWSDFIFLRFLFSDIFLLNSLINPARSVCSFGSLSLFISAKTCFIQKAIFTMSSSFIPLEVIAGVPSLIPDG